MNKVRFLTHLKDELTGAGSVITALVVVVVMRYVCQW